MLTVNRLVERRLMKAAVAGIRQPKTAKSNQIEFEEKIIEKEKEKNITFHYPFEKCLIYSSNIFCGERKWLGIGSRNVFAGW